MQSLESRFAMRGLSKEEILWAVQDENWQVFRATLHGVTLEERLALLEEYLNEDRTSKARHVQVVNYINALKRGGMIK